jgi:hypothetical protein
VAEHYFFNNYSEKELKATGGAATELWTHRDWFSNPRKERFEAVKSDAGYQILDHADNKFVSHVKVKGIRKQPPYATMEEAITATNALEYDNNQLMDFMWNHEDGGMLEDGGGLVVANAIKEQIGHKALYMLGAKTLVAHKDGLSFRIRGSNKANYVKITVAPNDTYNMEFAKIRAVPILRAIHMTPEQEKEKSYKVVAEHKGIYSDMLNKIIEQETGLSTKLFAQGGGIGILSIGDIFTGTPNGEFVETEEMYKPNRSYILQRIAPDQYKVIQVHASPYDAVTARAELSKELDNLKVHWEPEHKEEEGLHNALFSRATEKKPIEYWQNFYNVNSVRGANKFVREFVQLVAHKKTEDALSYYDSLNQNFQALIDDVILKATGKPIEYWHPQKLLQDQIRSRMFRKGQTDNVVEITIPSDEEVKRKLEDKIKKQDGGPVDTQIMTHYYHWGEYYGPEALDVSDIIKNMRPLTSEETLGFAVGKEDADKVFYSDPAYIEDDEDGISVKHAYAIEKDALTNLDVPGPRSFGSGGSFDNKVAGWAFRVIGGDQYDGYDTSEEAKAGISRVAEKTGYPITDFEGPYQINAEGEALS